jgi:hypothetical protein
MSIDQCREILGAEADLMSDAQVEAFRDSLYTIVDNVLDYYVDSGNVCR